MATNGVEKAATTADHAASSNVSLVQSFLAAHPKVRFFRYYMCDYSNLLRIRCTTASRALQIAANPNGGLATGSPIVAVGQQCGNALLELFKPGEDVWVPDWTSIRELSASEGTAIVLCFINEFARDGEQKGAEQRFHRSTCPRSILQKVVAEAKAKHDVDFLVGTEIEFTLVESRRAQEWIDSPEGIWTPATTRTPEWKSVVEEAVTLLEQAGVHVWTFCPEGGKSCYEISLSPLPPLEAIDAMHFAHETIKTVAFKNGCHATMHPMPFETGRHMGKHVHLSLSRPELGTPFLAGMMEHFRGLCALMMPSLDSYHRASQFGSGVVCWGWGNKLSCMRRIQDAYFEIRPPDTFANLYLTLAAIIGTGLRAVEDGTELTVKSMDELVLQKSPSEEQRKKWNIKHDLPANLEEALQAFKKDEIIKQVLGEKCFDAYLYNREKDREGLEKMNSKDRLEKLMENY